MKKLRTSGKLIASNSPQPVPAKFLSCKVGEYLYNRLENHVRSLKFLDGNIKKKEWLANALKEKLKRGKSLSLVNIPKEKHVQFPIDDQLHSELTKRLALIKKYRHYTAKQLLLEAIQEQLDREEESIKKRIARIDDSY